MSVGSYAGFLLFLLAGFEVANACRDNWVSFNNDCYLFVSTKLTWFHASKACRNQDSQLVDIQSKAEEDFIRGVIKRLHAHEDPQKIGYWTNGNDLDVEGQWMWGYPSNQPLTYTDWFLGEPNNHWYDGREEDCIALWGHDSHDYQWNDQPCDIQDYYICKTGVETDIVG